MKAVELMGSVLEITPFHYRLVSKVWASAKKVCCSISTLDPHIYMHICIHFTSLLQPDRHVSKREQNSGFKAQGTLLGDNFIGRSRKLAAKSPFCEARVWVRKWRVCLSRYFWVDVILTERASNNAGCVFSNAAQKWKAVCFVEELLWPLPGRLGPRGAPNFRHGWWWATFPFCSYILGKLRLLWRMTTWFVVFWCCIFWHRRVWLKEFVATCIREDSSLPFR